MSCIDSDDCDPIKEHEVEVHDGYPIDLVVSVRLDAAESRLLVAEVDGADPPTMLRAALTSTALPGAANVALTHRSGSVRR
jgi:hypothetical protein